MKLYAIRAEDFMLDGGGTFGVVPKTIWEKFYIADDRNLCNFSNRCLLVDNGEKKILIDTGMGHKRDDKFYQFKYLFGDNDLLKSLSVIGCAPEDITDVLFTHLHDDHCGGALRKDKESGEYSQVFPNAKHWVSRAQYNWAMNPNIREAAAYYAENWEPLREAGKLHFIEKAGELYPGIFIHIFNGHTQGQAIPEISYKEEKIVFAADFIPLTPHIPVPYIAAFDIQPLIALEEKAKFLDYAANQGVILFFEHDFYTECCTLQRTEKGVRLGQILTLTELI
ncbi:MAG: MBL fold metallo-hydrolase [Bacteroidetes bacterium]|nr:MBL fold metallo-hydrolase [Bacteroidota bacterium]MBU1719369.1 MBL fold metallo-hydrolase [Bacteroidota bacterium]